MCADVDDSARSAGPADPAAREDGAIPGTPGSPASPDGTGDPTSEFQRVFWATKRVLANASAAAFARHGVHEGQQYILLCLWEQDGLTPGEVARRLGLSTPTVTRATARMEAAGLLQRAPHGEDRRRVRLLLTDRGRQIERAIGQEMQRLSERALSSLDADERAALVRALGKVHRNLTAAPAEPPT